MDSRKPSPPSDVRLQKFLAECGIGSRRACEELIRSGVVTLNGTPVERQGVTITPGRDIVCVRGRQVRPEKKFYLALHKPRDVLCTADDPRGRRTWKSLVTDVPARLFTVGRLDRDSEGLILLTNDGAFSQALLHPRHEVEKVYHAWVDRPLEERDERAFLAGIRSEGERLKAASLAPGPRTGRGVCYEVVLREGRNRQVRRMFEACGCSVIRLKRVRVGSLSLGRIPRGAWRHLRPAEVDALLRTAGQE